MLQSFGLTHLGSVRKNNEDSYLFVPELGEGARYKFEIRPKSGPLPFLKADPLAFRTEPPPATASVVHDLHHYRWSDEQWMRSRAEGEAVGIEIADTGSGIRPEHLPRIFDPFFTTKPPGKGTGLGLWLAYGIVEKHGGRIEVRSLPGSGTTFRIVLPAPRTAARTPAPPAPALQA